MPLELEVKQIKRRGNKAKHNTEERGVLSAKCEKRVAGAAIEGEK